MAALLFALKALVVYPDATYFDWRLFQIVHHILGASPVIHYNLRKAGKKKLATLEQLSIFPTYCGFEFRWDRGSIQLFNLDQVMFFIS